MKDIYGKAVYKISHKARRMFWSVIDLLYLCPKHIRINYLKFFRSKIECCIELEECNKHSRCIGKQIPSP